MARFNRVVTNRVLGPLAGVAPGLGLIVHRGRRSGREYRTPVMVFRDGGTVVIALTYGPDSDWVRNTLAAGGCELLTSGRRVALTEPRILTAGARGVPSAVRAVLRRLDAEIFLSLRLVRTAGRP